MRKLTLIIVVASTIEARAEERLPDRGMLLAQAERCRKKP